MFSLAKKIAPTVIFLDEIDTLLKNRELMFSGTSAHSTMLGTFMSEWDGMITISSFLLSTQFKCLAIMLLYVTRVENSIKML